jgi:hypothetical protein
MTRRCTLLLALAVSFTPCGVPFQGNRVSPHETASVDVTGGAITIAYGRPYLKSREFGKDVAPFGKVWRLGADEATKLTVPATTKIAGGPTLPAGSYSLWAIPEAGKWTIIVNKKADVWGTRYPQALDVARFDLPVEKVAPLEEFTITLTKKSDTSAEVSFGWGTELVKTTLTVQ